MSRYTHLLGLVFFAFLLMAAPAGADEPSSGSQAAAPVRPVAALLPLADDGTLQVSDQDRCPLCGMFPAKRPKTAAAMALSDGRTFYFCGNGCMLRAWRDPARHLKAQPGDIARMMTKDFFRGVPLDAHQAWWVAGSDVIGPMGPALVALSTEGDVAQFQGRHGGRFVFQLSQMDDTLWQKLFPPKP